jgi:hypothetical protein
MLGLNVGLTVRLGLTSATELSRSAVKISATRANRAVNNLDPSDGPWVCAASNDRPATAKPTQNRTPVTWLRDGVRITKEY